MKTIIPADASGNSQFGAGLSLNVDGSFIGIGLADKGNNLQTFGEMQLFLLDEGGSDEYVIFDIVPVGAATNSVGETPLKNKLLIGKNIIEQRTALGTRSGGVGLFVVEEKVNRAARSILMADNGVCYTTAIKTYSGQDSNGDGFEDSTGIGILFDPNLDSTSILTSEEIIETNTFVSASNFAGNDTSLAASQDQRVIVMANSSAPGQTNHDSIMIFTNTIADPDGLHSYAERKSIQTSKSDVHRLGRALASNTDGSLIIASEPDYNVDAITGSFSIFSESTPGVSEDWSLLVEYSPSIQSKNSGFGGEMAATLDASVIVVTAPGEGGRGVSGNMGDLDPTEIAFGRAFVWRREGVTNVWTQEQVLDLGGSRDGNNSAYSIDISADGNRIVWGDTANGKVWTYVHDGTVWELKGSYNNPGSGGNSFGNVVHMSNDGSKIAISAKTQTTTGGANSGAVFVFEFSTGDITTANGTDVVPAVINLGGDFKVGSSIAVTITVTGGVGETNIVSYGIDPEVTEAADVAIAWAAVIDALVDVEAVAVGEDINITTTSDTIALVLSDLVI